MLKKQTLSFDIGTNLTKVVIGKGNANKVVIKEAFSFPTPMGTVEDGQIVDSAVLKQEILKKLDEKNIFTEKAVFTFASTKAIMRELTLPYVNEKKMEAMVPYELPKHLPISVENYVIKHLTLDVFKEDNIKKSRILVIALPKQLVKKYWDLCIDLEIEPIVMTLHGIGAGGFFQQKSEVTGEPETVALIDLGNSSINCNIISNGKLVFNRIISTVGMKTNLEKLANIDKDLSPTNYEKIVKDAFDKWLDEIKLVFRFYYSLKGRREIERVVLLGGASNIKDIALYFEDKLEKTTMVLQDNGRIIYKGNDDDFKLNQYFNAASALSLS